MIASRQLQTSGYPISAHLILRKLLVPGLINRVPQDSTVANRGTSFRAMREAVVDSDPGTKYSSMELV
jgi:hypothetical protein